MRWNHCIGLVLLVLFAFGCTSDEEKITRVLEKEINACKESEETFYEVVLFDESTVEILTAACDEEMGDIERIDEFKARTTTGPYTWLFGIDEGTGVWVLSGVSWESFDKGRRDATAEDAAPDVLQSGLELLGEAKKEWDGSRWIVMTRLETALEHRRKTRGKSENPTALGEQASKTLREAKDWAKENDAPEVAHEAELLVIDYFKDQRDKLEGSMANFGSSDEHLEILIEQAKKENNPENEKEYTAELEKMRAERPAQKAEVRRKILEITKNLCGHLESIGDDGEAAIGDRVAAVRNQIDCSPEGLETLKEAIDAEMAGDSAQ